MHLYIEMTGITITSQSGDHGQPLQFPSDLRFRLYGRKLYTNFLSLYIKHKMIKELRCYEFPFLLTNTTTSSNVIIDFFSQDNKEISHRNFTFEKSPDYSQRNRSRSHNVRTFSVYCGFSVKRESSFKSCKHNDKVSCTW